MCLEQTSQRSKKCWMPSRPGQTPLTMTRKQVEELLEKATSRDWIKTQHCLHLPKRYHNTHSLILILPATCYNILSPLDVHLYYLLCLCMLAQSYMFLIQHFAIIICNIIFFWVLVCFPIIALYIHKRFDRITYHKLMSIISELNNLSDKGNPRF